jgi:phenylalanine-4-hydroxylase
VCTSPDGTFIAVGKTSGALQIYRGDLQTKAFELDLEKELTSLHWYTMNELLFLQDVGEEQLKPFLAPIVTSRAEVCCIISS